MTFIESIKNIVQGSDVRKNKEDEEDELLIQISEITDKKVADKAKDLLHSEKHAYTFDTYLYWLSELLRLLLRGTNPDEALGIIKKCTESKLVEQTYELLVNTGKI